MNANSNAAKDEDSNINEKQNLIHTSFTLLGEAWPNVKQTQGKAFTILHCHFIALLKICCTL